MGFLPNQWWPSSFRELFIFIVLILFTIILVRLLHHNSIQRHIRKNSRCYRSRVQGVKNGVYSVMARNERNEPMYRVNYNLGSNNYDLECDCKPGNTVNRFENIKVYDARDPSNPVKRIPEKLCQCATDLNPKGTRVYYSGYPGVVRFMNNNDTTFFRS